MVSLRSRGIECDVVCPRCQAVLESPSHAIFDCPLSYMVWKKSRFWKVLENKRAMPFADFLRRIRLFTGGEAGDPQTIFDLSIASFGEWQALNRSPSQPSAVGSNVWSPPQPGYFKLNIDASVIPGSDHIGIGAVIRDEEGSILGAMARSVGGSFSPFVAECFALREGLRFAKEIKCADIEVETDAINVVSAVEDNRELSLECPILEDVKQLFAQVRSTCIHHIHRSANLVAHLLPRFGFNSNCINVWVNEIPSVVSNTVAIDIID
ncbi:hypothetical protein TIFTF001_001625 [Ficus carica]|uniref:RNase H type-1 domain-containing protein n=1 Tax=Ficus carica TaxID=3494 RepID=A0AA87Z9X1_FICCA|nr:hypothetical protein TIFTF001_001625 [Ficus carica]